MARSLPAARVHRRRPRRTSDTAGDRSGAARGRLRPRRVRRGLAAWERRARDPRRRAVLAQAVSAVEDARGRLRHRCSSGPISTTRHGRSALLPRRDRVARRRSRLPRGDRRARGRRRVHVRLLRPSWRDPSPQAARPAWTPGGGNSWPCAASCSRSGGSSSTSSSPARAPCAPFPGTTRPRRRARGGLRPRRRAARPAHPGGAGLHPAALDESLARAREVLARVWPTTGGALRRA